MCLLRRRAFYVVQARQKARNTQIVEISRTEIRISGLFALTESNDCRSLVLLRGELQCDTATA